MEYFLAREIISRRRFLFLALRSDFYCDLTATDFSHRNTAFYTLRRARVFWRFTWTMSSENIYFSLSRTYFLIFVAAAANWCWATYTCMCKNGEHAPCIVHWLLCTCLKRRMNMRGSSYAVTSHFDRLLCADLRFSVYSMPCDVECVSAHWTWTNANEEKCETKEWILFSSFSFFS